MGTGAGGLGPKNFDPARFNEGETIAKVGGVMRALPVQPSNQGAGFRFTAASAWVASLGTVETDFDTETAFSITPSTFVAPQSGLYKVTMNVGAYVQTGTVLDYAYRVKFTGATAVSVGFYNKVGGGGTATTYDAFNYHQLTNTQKSNLCWVGYVYLNAGTHTVLPQGRRLAGGANARAQDDGTFWVAVESVGGTASLFQEVLRESPYTLDQGFNTTSTWTALNTAVTSGNVTVPATGYYTFDLGVGWSNFNAVDPGGLRDYAVAEFRLKIDGVVVWTGARQAIVAWAYHARSNAAFTVLMTAGAHTWALEMQKLSGSHANSYVRVAGDDSFYLAIQGGAAVQSPQFTTPYRMAWASASQVNVSARVGSTMNLLFNDGIVRTHSGTLTFDFANGTGNNGLDTGSEAADTWYYLFAVASGTDFYLKATTTSPASGGPSGATVYKYLGAIRNNASSNLLQFKQVGSRFYWLTALDMHNAAFNTSVGAWVTFGTGFTGTYNTLARVVPATAGTLQVYVKMDDSNGGAVNQFHYSVDGGTTSMGHVQGWTATDVSIFVIPMSSPQAGVHQYVNEASNYLFVIAQGYEDDYVSM